MSESKSGRSTWDSIQSIILLLTPVLVAVLGYFFNKSLSEIESKIANVAAMKPFMEMIASEDITESKMGAYAIYLLKEKDDPKMAAQMILAPGKKHLVDVLVDIGTRNDSIRAYIAEIVEDLDMSELDTSQLTDIERRVLEITDKLDRPPQFNVGDDNSISSTAGPNTWLYLGNSSRKSRSDWIISQLPPNIGESYSLTKAANVRRGKPEPPNYKLPSFIKVAHQGDAITIDTFTVDKTGHVWARVILN